MEEWRPSERVRIDRGGIHYEIASVPNSLETSTLLRVFEGLGQDLHLVALCSLIPKFDAAEISHAAAIVDWDFQLDPTAARWAAATGSSAETLIPEGFVPAVPEPFVPLRYWNWALDIRYEVESTVLIELKSRDDLATAFGRQQGYIPRRGRLNFSIFCLRDADRLAELVAQFAARDSRRRGLLRRRPNPYPLADLLRRGERFLSYAEEEPLDSHYQCYLLVASLGGEAAAPT